MINKIKKLILMSIMGLMTTTILTNKNNYYSDLFRVYSVNDSSIQFINCNGHIYEMENTIGDIYTDEYYALTMYNNNTQQINDDIIINIKYVRIDKLMY